MIGFVFGEKANEYPQSIMREGDIRGVQGYHSLSEFVTKARRQKLVFDRVVILASCVVNQKEFEDLSRLLDETAPSAEVVLFARSFDEDDVSKVEAYYRYFRSPLYTDYTVTPTDTLTLMLLIELCRGSLDEFRNTKSMHKLQEIQVRVSGNREASGEGDESSVQPVLTKPMHAKGGLITTFSYGGRFFGRNKLTKVEIQRIAVLEDEANAVLK